MYINARHRQKFHAGRVRDSLAEAALGYRQHRQSVKGSRSLEFHAAHKLTIIGRLEADDPSENWNPLFMNVKSAAERVGDPRFKQRTAPVCVDRISFCEEE
jgi:hypothetical protein